VPAIQCGHDDCDVRGILDGLEDCNAGDDCIVHDASMTGGSQDVS
jgi:hypothetical protein